MWKGDVYEVEFPQQTQQLLATLRVPISLGLDGLFQGYAFQCNGIHSYTSRAIFWMLLPLYLLVLIVRGFGSNQ